MLGGILVVAALVLAVEIGVTLSREYLPGDPGYLVDERVRPASGGTGQPLELVVLGDSTVAGVGSPGVSESLPVLLAQRVADSLGREVHVVGYGRSGARTDDVRTEQLPLLADAGPEGPSVSRDPSLIDAVVIVIGSNDVTHVTPPWVMDERTEALLRATNERTGAAVILGGIPRFRAVPALAQPLRAVIDSYARPLRSAQRAAANEVGDQASFVDIAAEASPRFLGRPESMSPDGFHPSPVGYGFWADALAPAVVAAVD